MTRAGMQGEMSEGSQKGQTSSYQRSVEKALAGVVHWSRGMILASGVRGPRFKSWTSPGYPLGFPCEEIQPVHPKGDQSWVFIRRTDVEAEAPILWPPDVKSWLIWKEPDAGKDWRQEEKGMAEDEMVGWHHRLNGHGFGWTTGVGDGQGGLACCSSWGRKESDTTEQLNWTVAQLVKNPPAMRETWVWFLGWEDPLEKEKATHYSILAWRIPWTV